MGFVGDAAGSVLGGITGGVMNNGGGIKNTFAATAPDIQKQDLIKQIGDLTPNQNRLSQMLMDQAAGKGPNPAQLMLNQATNKNIQQGAGMIASQKGISPALAARLIAQNTANTNQTAAGQGATMNSQQQLAAQNLASQNTLGREQILQNAQAAQNQAITSGSLGAQQLNEAVAKQNADTAAKVMGGASNGLSSAMGPLADIGKTLWQGLSKMGSGVSGAGAGDVMAGATSAVPTVAGSSLFAGADTAAPMAAAAMVAKGGEITEYGDVISPSPTPIPQPVVSDPEDLKNLRNIFIKHARGGSVHPYYKQGSKVPIIVSPGELIVHPDGKRTKVPGRAKVKGDSTKNDTVPTMTEGGSVVVPRTKATSENKVAEFMAKVKETKEGRNEPGGFSRVLKAKKHLQSAHESLMAAHKAMKDAS